MTIEDKLKKLRKEWKENPDRRDIIATQARILKMSTYSEGGYITPKEKEEKKLIGNIADTLL